MLRIFSPAIYVLNKISFPRKLFVIVILVFASISLLVFDLYGHMNKIVLQTELEMKGVKQIASVNKLVQLTQQYRGLSAAKRNSNDFFHALYVEKSKETEVYFYNLINNLDPNMPLLTGYTDLSGDSDLSDLSDLWFKIKKGQENRRVEENFKKNTHFIRQQHLLAKLMAEHYKLIIDNEPTTYFLIDNLINTIPNVIESMGRIRAAVLGVLVNQHLSNAQKIQLIHLKYQLNRDFVELEFNFVKASKYSPKLSGLISKELKAIEEVKGSLINLIERV